MNINIDLSEEEWRKLQQLAKERYRSEIQCIKDFIATCQPGGSGWQHPMKAQKDG